MCNMLVFYFPSEIDPIVRDLLYSTIKRKNIKNITDFVHYVSKRHINIQYPQNTIVTI